MNKFLCLVLLTASATCLGAIGGSQDYFQLKSDFFDELNNAYYSELKSESGYRNDAQRTKDTVLQNQLIKTADQEKKHSGWLGSVEFLS